ncbi:MAG TPA: D-lyxose/D-mannose family sugar isomerase [Phycisphaerae bacterium]|nr:D-lyxose/D-mannose family sugar isomerase [Phycisphaerae bacterium]
MLTLKQIEEARSKALDILKQSEIAVTQEEAESIEISDYGLGDFKNTGLAIVVYVNTNRCCAKELVMLPHQTCPQHRHPPFDDSPGKEETFRCRRGKCYLYVEGEPTATPACKPPEGSEPYYTVWNEIVLEPGDQYTLQPNIWHWFQAGSEGAIVSEFSTRSTDENDIFTDNHIVRKTGA